MQQQHSPVGVGPLDFSRRGVAETSAFRVVKPKQPTSSLVHQQAVSSPETNNNENLQENSQVSLESEGKILLDLIVKICTGKCTGTTYRDVRRIIDGKHSRPVGNF